MSNILKKRGSLLKFIEEQIIGPGANGITYSRLNNVNNLTKPINYSDEIINYQPLSLGYSSAILFPKKKILKGAEETGSEEDEETGNGDMGEENVEERIEEFELDQQFPRQMGMTFCLKQEFIDKKEDLKIEVSFRTYQKLDKKSKVDEGNKNPIGVYIKERKDEFIKLLECHKEFNSFFEILKKDEDASLLHLRRTSLDDLKELKALYKNLLDRQAKVLIEKLKQNGFKKIDVKYISTIKKEINRVLKIEITDIETKDAIFKAYSQYEQFEWFVSYIKDLIKIEENEIWEAKTHNRIVKISGLDLGKNEIKKAILHNKPHNYTLVLLENDQQIPGGLESIYVNKISKIEGSQKLCLNIQLSRDSRDKKNMDKEFYVKLQLVNESTEVREGKIDNKIKMYSVANKDVNRKAFYGVVLRVTNNYLKPYTRSNGVKIDNEATNFDEEKVSKFSYKMYEDFGTGHGCSIKWNKNDKVIETTYLPIVDTPDVDVVPRDKSQKIPKESFKINKPFIENSRAQEFKFLSTFSDETNEAIIKELKSFINSYKTWIENKKLLHENALEINLIKQELGKCELDYQRMSKNIQFLEDDDKMLVFRLMNSAMFMQLLHIRKGGKTGIDIKKNNDKDYYKNASDTIFSSKESAGWRAFQLAFIILNLDGIFKHADDENWEKRNDLVDLVWFPTGGGKTEAYLGLIALVILNRRLNKGKMGGGVSVIMRYTLRLLTLQQFQRASYLIMALELMRRWKIHDLGEEPITIGLWVGASSLPNKLEGLKTEIEKLLNGQENNIPFQHCPWCGGALKKHTNHKGNIYETNRLTIDCSNLDCSFFSDPFALNTGLPLNLCDESIYQHPPSLLFGTVDKFAQLAHKTALKNTETTGDSRRLFGRGIWEKGKPTDGYLPPDLIIQDELHLLLGPLGSAVGLFESAVDQLCKQKDGTLPKLITSTATTRNTELQIAGLFNRKVQIFPKQGVECDDTFFSFYKRYYDENGDVCFEAKRRYMGIMPTGRSQVWMQMRLAAIMLTHRAVFESEHSSADANPITGKGYSKDLIEAMDNYHSLISYFNSTREVGKTQSQIQTYIKKEMLKVFNRAIRPSKMMYLIYAHNDIEEGELTGRLSGEAVKSQLDSVSKNWKPAKRFASTKEKGNIPPEFIAATNMISVGLDVGRFNQILMNSMPRNTAEYIQASSRVARSKEGLVITIHHPFKSRDVSHFEKFIEFHEKMYSYVEPISITPFTNKAVKKYLSLYIATMVRHLSDEKFAGKNGAGELRRGDIDDIKTALMSYFIKRVAKWESNDNADLKNILKQENLSYISNYIDIALGQWFNEAENKNYNLHYKKWRERAYLFNEEGDLSDNENTSHWSISGSLRVIEPNSVIKIK